MRNRLVYRNNFYMSLLHSSCRVAFSALLHDLGKFHERTGQPVNGDLAALTTLYKYSHAAHTGGMWDVVEKFAPDLLRGDVSPFSGRTSGVDITDSMANAAAAHHKPGTLLQWIIATADRAASGFERKKFDEYNADAEGETPQHKNRFQARMMSLFEQIRTNPQAPAGQFAYAYPLRALGPEAIFPDKRAAVEPDGDKSAQTEYAALWEQFMQALASIPQSHRNNWPLWLDHFDSAWLAYTQAIPSATNRGVVPDVSLYDHSKAVAALAAALWRWHEETGNTGADALAKLSNPERPDWDEQKLLLIQGDFFGIQNFIFAQGAQTQKHAHKLLRGRSFQVALLAEMAALKLLETLQLPSTSQIINAAGKFLIVAPNTQSAREAVETCRHSFDQWCLQHTYGEIGVGIAQTAASCNDLVSKQFKALTQRLFTELDIAKHRRFDLCDNTAAVREISFTDGPCGYHGRYPADRAAKGEKPASCALSRDQIAIGEALTKHARLLVLNTADSFKNPLDLDYFGYRLVFVNEADASGHHGKLAEQGELVRAWDFDLPEADGSCFHGYARRFVNSYVPIFDNFDQQLSDKYGRWEDEAEFDREHPIKTLHHIACENRRLQENGKWLGEIALVTLKGDIDNLGALFQNGLEEPTFASWAALSRQVNAFFALWLPWYCAHGENGRFRNTYTVFAGGDDFFLIGPWESTLELASAMRKAFTRYVVRDDITFSLGAAMTQPKVPARQLAIAAEAGLHAAKRHDDDAKNAVSLWDVTVNWTEWRTLMEERRDALAQLISEAGNLSTGFIYNLLLLSDQAERDRPETANRRPEDALWRSRLAYRCARLPKHQQATGKALARECGEALKQYRGAYRLPVSVLLYRQRQ
ncbi:CRISPR-associated protein, Csm1 family [Nitrosomonas eutropha C91]|uniref:CRISPR system single-strand-specific deoxyribonuclease Cas10/Csm1 (subtype III-A) n=3 Tax=Nitrosomonas eutropha TaxID=916 RepID=A0ABX5M8B5_9PROT|nr:CRISPR-associated protein, Csm1 family [Nitrosomonas eutropha C91]PXV77795.1 CRISPR-associated protein Cas10/Csm1 (subtype III-A) [Nitrosomonas eutropha]SEJ26348.1 CRISPR-associated protein Cas10/Csm1, subtype III-A/MTUBE [Nitrosomonas eutropha]